MGNPKLAVSLDAREKDDGIRAFSVQVLMWERPETTDMADAMKLTGVMPYAMDPVSADRLWDLSKSLLGL